jgi:RNA polymerase sigma-70 factor (ECF subfamily)
MQKEADGQLVRHIARGGQSAPAAEAELCRRFAPRIRLYGLRHLRDEHRARDLTQSVLLAVLEAARLDRVEDPDKVDRFILGTCRNIASRTRELQAREVPGDEALDLAPFLPELEMIETTALVRCLATLDARSKTVVRGSYHDDRSAEDIALELQTTPGNVRVLRHRALAQLRRCLDAHRSEAE